jgi:hypothetical protein
VGIVDVEAINGRVRAGLLKAAVTAGAFRNPHNLLRVANRF